MQKIHSIRSLALAAAAIATGVWAIGSPSPASAQAVIASVNDDPITNIDVDQHEKILRVLHKPASSQAAMDDVIETRLKLIETAKFKINPGTPEINFAMGYTARNLKVDPQVLLATLKRAGVTDDQVQQKWKSEAAWMMYIRALNRTLDVSESDVRAELAKQGSGSSTQFTVRQVIFVVPGGSGAAVIGGQLREAASLRDKFNDCSTGAQLVASYRDAVIKTSITRPASALNAQLKQLLEKTPVGHLTPPQRGVDGIEMLAVCSKSDKVDTEAADTVRNDMVAKLLEGESARRYKEVRSRAIVVKR